MLRIIACPYCHWLLHSCVCKMWNSKRYVLPGGNLLEIHEDIIRIFEYNQLVGKYYYLTSREVIDNEVQWLKIDNVIVSDEHQKYISSMVRNAAFI